MLAKIVQIVASLSKWTWHGRFGATVCHFAEINSAACAICLQIIFGKLGGNKIPTLYPPTMVFSVQPASSDDTIHIKEGTCHFFFFHMVDFKTVAEKICTVVYSVKNGA